MLFSKWKNFRDNPSAKQPKRDGDGEGQEPTEQRRGGPQEELSDRLLGLPDDLPDSDEANLEYAKKATSLALKYLKDQQDTPDPDLLKDLGITAEELRAMVSRYEKLQQQSQQNGENHDFFAQGNHQ